MESNFDYFIPPFESRSSYSSEFEENRQMHKVDGHNVFVDTNLISSITTTPNRLVCCRNTSDDESSDHLRPNIPIDENNAEFPIAPILSLLRVVIEQLQRTQGNPNEKMFLLERKPSEKESVSYKARKNKVRIIMIIMHLLRKLTSGRR
ncbi:hypothetical protein AVEN_21073-1 [Araneus ventricosus]|uniref:Uncharacterized protein n=1 Tax=Araneus ventricosus TaxID=182803 RepID=A0A4Y2FJB5_ARAVE|nr:hypothetical protein AVEN_21073-1 [Araneus ventricosus]